MSKNLQSSKQGYLRSVAMLLLLMASACELDPDFKNLPANTTAPVARFSFTKVTDPCIAPCNVMFNNTSLNAQNYAWDFGDGGTSVTQNPSHIFQTSGSFDVTLTAENGFGSHDTTMTVVVKSDTPTFFRRFGGSGMDFANSVIESQDFYVITGSSNSADLLGGQTTDQLIIWKFDLLGGKVWTNPKALKANSYGNSIIEDGTSNYVVVGYERNTVGTPSLQTPVFVRYTTDGTIARLRDLSNPMRMFVDYTVLTDVLRVGDQYAITGFSGLCAPGCNHILLSYLDAQGAVIEDTWSTDSFQGSEAQGRSIAKSPLRVVSMGDQDGDIIVRENPGINTMMLFDERFLEPGTQVGNDMVGTNDGTFAIVGNIEMGTNGGFDVLFFVIDNAFTRVGQYVNIGGPVSDFAQSVITVDGDFVIAGSSNSFSDGDDFDVYLIRVDKNGTIVWEVTYEDADGDDFAQEIIATADGGFLITGYTEYSNMTTDIFLMKTDALGEVIE